MLEKCRHSHLIAACFYLSFHHSCGWSVLHRVRWTPSWKKKFQWISYWLELFFKNNFKNLSIMPLTVGKVPRHRSKYMAARVERRSKLPPPWTKTDGKNACKSQTSHISEIQTTSNATNVLQTTCKPHSLCVHNISYLKHISFLLQCASHFHGIHKLPVDYLSS